MRWFLAISVCILLAGVILLPGFLASSTREAEPEIDPTAADPVDLGGGQPRAVVDNPKHDFGLVDPDGKCQHVFVIRNAGTGYLKLRTSESSCKCVLSKLPARVLGPGQVVRARVEVVTRDRTGPFTDRIEIFSNDTNNPTIVLEMTGTIRTFLGCDPPRLQWTDMRASRDNTAEVVVYSQVWDRFEIHKVDPSLECLSWETEPAAAEKLTKLGATSGYRLRVTVPSGAFEPTARRFHETLMLVVNPPDNPGSFRSLPVVLSGAVSRGATPLGRRIDGQGVLRLGAVTAGQAIREHVLFRLRDIRRPVNIESVETTPDFLIARIQSGKTAASRSRVFRVDVEIPADAPPGNHTGTARGKVVLKTDHPDLGVITLPVDFAVVGDEEHPLSR
ncbi:MAG: DUF1573 domain-containing protein [Pirellulales bacterium]|nr:DUF1573 domain-containing protein [Pirellulales bacterium]